MGIQQMNEAADRIASQAVNVGYDQGQRWSFYDRETGRLIPGQECDCSSSCGAIAALGGYPVDLRDPFYTGNFLAKMTRAGFSGIPVGGWSAQRLFGELRPGDFLVGPGHVIYVRSAAQWWSAEADERGRKAGGQGGDQTGLEARMRAPYMRPRGWSHIVRPPAESAPVVVVVPPLVNVNERPPLLTVDGELGPKTIRALQQWAGAHPDGEWGPLTTKAIQRKLGIRDDGKFGPISVRALQAAVGANGRSDKWGPSSTRSLQEFLNRLDRQGAVL